MCVYIYIYISLSLYIYIYIYISVAHQLQAFRLELSVAPERVSENG